MVNGVKLYIQLKGSGKITHSGNYCKLQNDVDEAELLARLDHAFKCHFLIFSLPFFRSFDAVT